MVPVTVNAIRCHSSQVLEGLPMNVLTFTLDRVRHPGGWSFSSHACTRPLLALSLLAVVVGAGCGDDPGGARVTIQTGQPPALVAFRAWLLDAAAAYARTTAQPMKLPRATRARARRRS